MLTLFKSQPLLSDSEVEWLIDTFVWACEQFDGQYFMTETQIIEPTGAFFPDQVTSVEQMASTVFNRVSHYAGMQAWPISVVNPQQHMPQQSMPMFSFIDEIRGEKAKLVNPPALNMQLSYNPNQINQPQDLVASFAGSLATVMIYHRGVLPPGGEEQIAAASDALACFLGFGVMMSNTVYQFKGGCGSCYNPYANRQAALTEPQTVFMHALICHFKPQVDGKKHLKPHLRSVYKKAQKQLKLYINDTPNPILLALEEQRHARLS
ncbi:hypothetical protein J8L98_05730 [Pseudoalteromonas sp. MMG013]|uniref:Orphan protein n=1 Tax=Pseudoalteromonas aurantia 208 TaxID=1314867 RepID=A0ABR9EF24_9GAMM|nr:MULTISPECIES: hypothetical protein [Pseudoalteromonas]MBE0369570.1 hypothetical protein [Pseudoalteromonas aurantia 208]MBQ4844107.1 hypothetical protein [Pseudoalteromonas sp. MMG005]MBQ4861189.1 hypothetical protein [Pseudoalteromonas sp. MMG013]